MPCHFFSFAILRIATKKNHKQCFASNKKKAKDPLSRCLCVCVRNMTRHATLLIWLVYHLHLRHVIIMILWRFIIVKIIHAMSISTLRITSYHFVSLRITSRKITCMPCNFFLHGMQQKTLVPKKGGYSNAWFNNKGGSSSK